LATGEKENIIINKNLVWNKLPSYDKCKVFLKKFFIKFC